MVKRTPNELRVGDKVKYRGRYRSIIKVQSQGRGYVRVRFSMSRPSVKFDSLVDTKE